MVSIVFPAPRGAWQAPKISPRGLRNASEKKQNLTVSYGFLGFPGPPGSVLRRFTEILRWLEKVREGQEKVGEGQRRSEKVRESVRKWEKVRESMRNVEPP